MGDLMSNDQRGPLRSSNESLLCPSAQPDMPDAAVLGVMGGTADAPQLAYMVERLSVSEDVLALAGPAKPTEVFRFAAPCEEMACRHFDGNRCRLASRIVDLLPTVTDALPPCRIRRSCRWFAQEGPEACLRCPQVLTENYAPSELVRQAAEG
jgi:hypothetical protein